MPYYELVADGHAKFWSIERKGKTLTSRWGRIGSAGQSKVKDFASPKLAEQAHDRLVANKLREGYQAARATGANRSKPGKSAARSRKAASGPPKLPPPRGLPVLPPGVFSPLELWFLGLRLQFPQGEISRRMRLEYTTELASREGKLAIGDPTRPRTAIQITAAARGQVNHAFILYTAVCGDLHGVRFTGAMTVRWAVQPPIQIGHCSKLAIWTPGRPFDRQAIAVEGPLSWAIGYNASGTPTSILYGRAITPALLAAAARPLPPYTSEDLKKLWTRDPGARDNLKDQPAYDDHEEAPDDDELRVTPATDDELRGLAWAISNESSKRFSRRFEISWEKLAIPPKHREIIVGDPVAHRSGVDVIDNKPKRVFILNDRKADGDERTTIVGVRLRAGEPVSWDHGPAIGVDGGMFGVWSPDYVVDDIGEPGPYRNDDDTAAAFIRRTAYGDGTYASVFGLDRRKREVCLLFGDGVRPAVFGLK